MIIFTINTRNLVVLKLIERNNCKDLREVLLTAERSIIDILLLISKQLPDTTASKGGIYSFAAASRYQQIRHIKFLVREW